MSDDAQEVSPRVVELVSGLTDGRLSLAERAELRELLATDRAALNWYLEWMSLHTMLHLDLAAGDSLPTPRLARVHRPAEEEPEHEADWVDPEHILSLLEEEAAVAERHAREAEEEAKRLSEAAARREELYFDRSLLRTETKPTPRGWYVATAVAASIIIALGWQVLSPPPLVQEKSAMPKEQIAVAPAPPQFVGTIAKSFEAKWREPRLAMPKGAQLAPGLISLERGVVEISLLRGVRMVIEAPAVLELVSADRVNLKSGRVVANVPPEGIGFTLRTQAASFVDLGTEFGVEVTEEGAASIHVLEGEVALVQGDRNRGEPSRMLSVGAAHQVSADGGSVRSIAHDGARFLRRVPHSAYELAVLKSRPLAYWRLDKRNAPIVSDGRLALDAFVADGIQLVDPQQAPELRDGPDAAARFAGDHEGILITTDEALGTVSDCTYEAWVFASSVAEGPQRIFSTFDRPRSGMAIGVVDSSWNQQSEPGVKFHLTMYGVYDCVSTAAIELGNWVHLAATVDEVGKPSLYLNGELVGHRFRTIAAAADPFAAAATGGIWRDSVESPLGIRTKGEARIGRNPPGSDGQVSPERWQGLISHVAVYGRVLSAEEIHRHFRATRDDEIIAVEREL